jgi:hypothetical protein
VAAAACSGDPAEPEPCDEDSTWTTVGEPYARTWCTSCHSSELPLDQRYGAPAGMDFDTLAGIRAVREAAHAVVEAGRMPPAGGPEPAEAERFADWLRCGALGIDSDPAEGCEAAVAVAGDAVIGDAAAASALCTSPVSLEGHLLVSAGATVACLCDVGGRVAVTGGDVALPALRTIGGDLTVDGATSSLSLPALTTVGGSVLVQGAVTSLGLDALVEVGGSLEVADAAGLTALPTARLRTVGGDLVVAWAPALEAVDLSRLTAVPGELRLQDAGMVVLLGEAYALESVGGDLVLASLPAWQGFYGFANLVGVGGDLRIEGAPSLERLRGFTQLEQVGGTLSVSGNASLGLLDGFDNLQRVEGDLVVADNPALFGESAFARIDSVGGALRIVDNPALGSLRGLALPREVGSLWLEGNDAMVTVTAFSRLESVGDLRLVGLSAVTAIDGFGVLAEVRGDLELRALPALSQLALGSPGLAAIGGRFEVRGVGLEALTVPGGVREVGADVVIAENPALVDLTGLHALDRVEGDLVVTDNPALSDAGAAALAAEVVVGGTVTISGNGG